MARLGRYVNDGSFCIDKKLVENAGRPVDLGRKTSCFAGITMLLSYALWSVAARLWGGDPSEWMEDVLVRVSGNDNKRDVLRGLLHGRGARKTK